MKRKKENPKYDEDEKQETKVFRKIVIHGKVLKYMCKERDEEEGW